MKKTFLSIFLFAAFAITVVYCQEKDHPIISIGFTELLQTENLLDDYSVDLRLFKNLDHGFAFGGKIGSDFDEMFEAGASIRKTLLKTLYAYGDGGYSFNYNEGGFCEIGIGTYFLKSRLFTINLGFKHYFGTSKSYVPVGFTINF